MLQTLSGSTQNGGSDDLLFPKSVDSLKRLDHSCQAFVFDISSAIPFKHLKDMSSLPTWGQEESMWSTTTSDFYGTLLQAYTTQAGEHMLALVQALEPFTSDKEGLQLASSVMQGVGHFSDKLWKKFARAINAESDDSEFVSMIRQGDAVKDFILNFTENRFEEDEEDDEFDSAAQVFCNQWLDAVCSAVTEMVLEQTMRF